MRISINTDQQFSITTSTYLETQYSCEELQDLEGINFSLEDFIEQLGNRGLCLDLQDIPCYFDSELENKVINDVSYLCSHFHFKLSPHNVDTSRGKLLVIYRFYFALGQRES